MDSVMLIVSVLLLRLQLYDFVELKVQGDGYCQAEVHYNTIYFQEALLLAVNNRGSEFNSIDSIRVEKGLDNLGAASPVHETNSPIVGGMSPLHETDNPVVGPVSPLHETSSPIVGGVSPLHETDSPIVGVVSQLHEIGSP
ncbi:hypothetical protein ACFE04_030157 [Oxalis oulophora]